MDFGALLHVAKKNSESTKNGDGKYYSTKFAPPKKESKDKKLSNNIQKFLAKKEQEERERSRIEKEKRDQLLALRDEKSKNKIKKMLKVIKSANKSVLDDAVDTEHTAVTRQGPEQPDQDDYGYVSTEADAFYQKYIEKVKDVKEEKVFAPSRPASKTDLTSTKDRVKAAIMRENLEKSMPHTRVRTAAPKLASALTTGPVSGSLRRKDIYDPEAEREEEEKKKREEEQKRAKLKKPPPALDFQALLKLAEKKQFEPLEIVTEPKKKEPERLLTKKERKEQEERQRFFEERERRKKEMEKGGKAGAIPKVAPERQKMEPNGRIPKLNQSGSVVPKATSSSSSSVSNTPAVTSSKSTESKSPIFKKPIYSNTPAVSSSRSTDSKSPIFKKPLIPPITSSSKSVHSSPKTSSSPSASASSGSATKSSMNGGGSSSRERPIQKSNPAKVAPSSSKPGSSTTTSSSALSSSSGRVPHNGPTREFPPKDLKTSTTPKAKPPQVPQKTRQFPPPDVRRPSKQPEKKPQALKRRIYDDDDEDEYDSELDDFIDDGPEEEDYSQHIKAIFGYDKNRYRDVDDDDAGMESSFAQQMREEYLSKKIGLMEDLEDMRQEAEDKKRKAMKRKKLH